MMSLSRKRKYSLSSSVTFVPPYSGSKTRSPTLTLGGMRFPVSVFRPGPTAITVASKKKLFRQIFQEA